MASVETRLATLEANFHSEKHFLERQISTLQADLTDLQIKLAYYDRMALKWGYLAMGALTIAALATMGADKLKDKILSWWFGA